MEPPTSDLRRPVYSLLPARPAPALQTLVAATRPCCEGYLHSNLARLSLEGARISNLLRDVIAPDRYPAGVASEIQLEPGC